MHVQQLTVKKVDVIKFNFKTKQATIQVQFQDEDPLTFNSELKSNHQQIAHKLIRQIKQSKKKTELDFDDDILGNISLIHLQNDEEKLFESIYKGLARLESKIKNLMSNQSSTAYMDTLYALKNVTEVLYRV